MVNDGHSYNPAGRNLRSVWNIATQPTPYAHFATFPEKLVEPCIKAGTSARGCCPECAAPWERVVEKEKYTVSESPRYTGVSMRNDADDNRTAHNTTTTGWQPTCDCDTFGGYQPQPCTVLDPFHGSGTTGIVALKLGRAYVGVDISEGYLDGVSNERMQRGAQIGMAY